MISHGVPQPSLHPVTRALPGADHPWRPTKEKLGLAWNSSWDGALICGAAQIYYDRSKQMHSIIYIIGLVVVVVAILNFIA